MHTVSMTRSSSSRAMIAAGTRPPRVTATIASNGPEPARRQASARASRWNWSQETGKAFSRPSGMRGFLLRGPVGRPLHSKRRAGARARAAPVNSFGGPRPRPRGPGAVSAGLRRGLRFRPASPRSRAAPPRPLPRSRPRTTIWLLERSVGERGIGADDRLGVRGGDLAQRGRRSAPRRIPPASIVRTTTSRPSRGLWRRCRASPA